MFFFLIIFHETEAFDYLLSPHSPIQICQKVLLIVPSEYIQSPTTSDHLHSYNACWSHQTHLDDCLPTGLSDLTLGFAKVPSQHSRQTDALILLKSKVH